MNWQQLLTPVRLGQENFHDRERDNRNQFQRDYDRLIFSAPFRRLQNKTQVFPLPGSVFVHNRLTHSLEVASVGRSLGMNVAEFHKKEKGISIHLINGNTGIFFDIVPNHLIQSVSIKLKAGLALFSQFFLKDILSLDAGMISPR